MEKQCELLSIHRSGLYYQPCPETPLNLDLMKIIDLEYMRQIRIIKKSKNKFLIN